MLCLEGLRRAARQSDNRQIRVADSPASENIDGERKTVTALFADIKGSTELEQDLDPEEARAIVDPALKLMIDAVRRYDGYIVQSTGDGIFALFGAPVAHEDHPQRALYAALRMQEELKRYAARLREAGSLPIESRVGVNTGEVVVRSISTGQGHVEYTPIGHTTNLASRMEALAPTGSIAVSEQTRRLCEGYFVLKPLGPTKVKGVSEPVNVYEVTGLGPLRTRLQRSAGRGLTKFVGRQAEMDALKRAAEQAKAGRGQIVAAMAEAGVGKSRLFFEFKATSQSAWMVLETFSVSHGKASAYLPVIDLLHGYFRIAAEDDARPRREKVNGRVLTLDRSVEDALPYLFALLGIVEGEDQLAGMDAQIRKRRTLDAVKRLLLRESLNQPLMVIFEDLHWIDDETQALLNLLADSIGTARILMLVNYRPEYSHHWGSKTYYTQLRLDPLGEESAAEMLSALVGAGEDLIPLKRRIIEKTEGNPFFVEETVLALLDEGALVRNGTVKLTKPLTELKIPPTVQAIIASRIDRLPSDEKNLLQTLAVTGREFPLSLIREVVPKSDDELNRMLGDLQLGEFIYEQPPMGDVEYTFKHALTREVAYNSMLTAERRRLHLRTARAIESLHRERLDDHCDELAHHYRHGGDSNEAIRYLELAGLQASRRSAYGQSLSAFNRALDLLQTLPPGIGRDRRELRLQLLLGETLLVVKGPASRERENVLQRAYELSRALGDNSRVCMALSQLSNYYMNVGEGSRGRDCAQEALHAAQNVEQSAAAQCFLAQTTYFLGDCVAARDHAERAIEGIRLHPGARDRGFAGFDPHVLVLVVLSRCLWWLGFPDRALAVSQEELQVADQRSDAFSFAFARCYGSEVLMLTGDHEGIRGRAAALEALTNVEGPYTFTALRLVAMRGWLLVQNGQTDRGIETIRQVLATHRANRYPINAPFHAILLADACAKGGRTTDGSAAVAEGLRFTEETGQRYCEAELHRLKGEFILKQSTDSAAEALECFHKSLDVARSQAAKSWELRATMSLARLLARQGKHDEARAMLADIYNWFTEGFDTADLKDAKALLEELGGSRV